MDFLAFMEERGKENNTYFIGVFIIENVEVRLIENGSRKYRDIVRLNVCLCQLLMNIFSVLRGSYHTKNIWLLSKPRQRSDSGNLPMDLLAFIEQTRKENNTYFIYLLIIENVELERVLWRECFIEKKFTMFSQKGTNCVRFYYKRFCLLFYFCILNHIISFVIFRSWV